MCFYAEHNCITHFEEDPWLWQFGFGFYFRNRYKGFTKWPTDLFYRAFYNYSLRLLAMAKKLKPGHSTQH